MTDLFTNASFGGLVALDQSVAATLSARLFNLLDQVTLTDTERGWLQNGLDGLGLARPQRFEMAGDEEINRAIHRNKGKMSYPALLASFVPGPLGGAFELLKAHTLAAALITESLAGSLADHKTRINRGLAACRRLSESDFSDDLREFSKGCQSFAAIHDIASIGTQTRRKDCYLRLKILVGTVLDLTRAPGRTGPRAQFGGFVSFFGATADTESDDHVKIEIEQTFQTSSAVSDFDDAEYSPSAMLVHVTEKFKPGRVHVRKVSQKALNRAKWYFREQQYFPSDPTNLTRHEISLIVSNCIEEIQTHSPQMLAAWLVLASIALGRRAKTLQEMTVVPPDRTPSQKAPAFCYLRNSDVPALMIPAISSHAEAACAPVMDKSTSKHHELLLPAILAASLADIAPSLSSPVDVDSWLARFKLGGGRRLTQRRVARCLGHAFAETDHDRTIAAVILGETMTTRPGTHYLPLEGRKLNEVYHSVLRHLGFPEEPHLPPSEIKAGSSRAPTIKAVNDFYEQIPIYLGGLSRTKLPHILAYHNRYMAVVALSLTILTGHRPVRAPFDTFESLDLANGWLFVCDKEVRSVASGRVIPLPDVAISQMRAWRTHTTYLIERLVRMPIFDSKLGKISFQRDANRLDETILHNRNGALFFTLAAEGGGKEVRARVAGPSDIAQQLQDIWLPALRGPRHALRRHATAAGLRSELADLMLGHAAPGNEPYARWSGLSAYSLEELRQFLDDYARSIGARVFHGFAEP